MRLRFVFPLIAALILAACTTNGEEQDAVSTAVSQLEETVQPLEETVQPLQETAEPALTDSAATVEAVVTESALACEELPEVTTEGEDGVTVPRNVVVVFQKTGGFAGINETTMIYADGFIENDKSETFQAPPAVVQTLVTSAEDVGFFDLQRSFVPENHCCDYFNYSLTIRDCEQVNTVITADEVPGAPAALTMIINTIQELISNTSAAVPSPNGVS